MTTTRKTTFERVTFFSCTLLFLLAAVTRPAHADATPEINRIERLRRAERPQAYLVSLNKPGLSAPDRAALVRAFAKHAKDLSPLYTKGIPAAEARSWINVLRNGFDAQRPDPDVAWALAQLLIDANDTAGALPVVAAFKKAFPQNHAALAWDEWCQSPTNRVPAPNKLLTFPLHFVLATNDPAARRAVTREACREETELLNKTFRTLDGKQLVKFEFKSFTPYEPARAADTELVRALDTNEPYNGDRIMKAFNDCREPRVRDPRAVNVYVFDSHSSRAGDQDMTSHGKRNSNRPYVLLDFQRLGGKVQNAIAHEMGHAFGLEHVGVPGATVRSSTNLMTSAAESFGSGGLRDLGFTPAQSAIVLYHAQRTHDRLGRRD